MKSADKFIYPNFVIAKNYFMKNLILLLVVCLGVQLASAQEIYNSSGKGKPGFKKTTKKKKGYDPDNLIIGGGLNAAIGDGFATAGVAPLVGYRFFKNFSAGIGFGYQYNKLAIYQDPLDGRYYYEKEHVIYPSVWAKYFVYNNIFVTGAYEYDFINLDYPFDKYGNFGSTKSKVTNPCLLLGAGMRFPMGGRVSFYGELIYDVLQGQYSPYPKNSPDLRFGVMTGF